MGIEDPKWGKASDDRTEEKDDNVNGGNKPLLGGLLVVEVMNPPTSRKFGAILTKSSVRCLVGSKKAQEMETGTQTTGGPSGGMPPINFDKKFAVGGIIGFVFLWLASGFYIVEEGNTALVLRFGEYKYSANAGFNWRFPIRWILMRM